MKPLISKSILIYTGLDEYYKKEFSITNMENLRFRMIDFQAFNILPALIRKNNFDLIIKNIPTATESVNFAGFYVGSDKLSLRFCIKENILIIISTGETQPALYKIYLEGVWELEDGDLS